MPIDTGKKTKAGRPLWEDPATGELYSEKTRTIPLKTDDNGEPLPGTKWINVPTVFDGGQIIDDEDFLRKFYQENKFKDPITNKSLEVFSDPDTAVEAAKQRSSELLD